MSTLYEMLKKQKEKYGLTEELKQKIDVFYLSGRLTEAEYRDLMDLPPIEPDEEVEPTEELVDSPEA